MILNQIKNCVIVYPDDGNMVMLCYSAKLDVAQKYESLCLVYETLLLLDCTYLPWAKAQDED